jgi:GIY-YIG catalytic domain
MSPLPTPDQAVRGLTDVRRRASPSELHRLSGTDEPGIYAWFIDVEGAEQLADGIELPVSEGLIYAGQAGAGRSHATLGSRVRGNHLGSDISGSTFRLTLASALRGQLALEPIGSGHMNRDGEGRLTSWMREHLMVSVFAYPDRSGLEAFETVVLERLDPPLNIAKRPPTSVRMELTILRRAFSRRAAGTTEIDRPRPPSAPAGSRTAGEGPTPEDLARRLGLPDAKAVRAFLRDRFPRPASELGTRWGSLTPEMERAVRDRFGASR